MIENICERLKKYIETNKTVLKKAISMDEKICGQKIEINEIIDTIENMKHIKESKELKSIGIVYDGEIKRTIQISLTELAKNNNCIFFVDDDLLAINSVIINMINRILNENNINNFIKIYNKVKLEDIITKSKQFDKIICTDEFEYEYIKNNVQIPVEYLE